MMSDHLEYQSEKEINQLGDSQPILSLHLNPPNILSITEAPTLQ